jgi:hypothetical protein
MTLAWFNAYMHDYGWPQAKSVAVNHQSLAAMLDVDGKIPQSIIEKELNQGNTVDQSGTAKRGVATFLMQGAEQLMLFWNHRNHFYKMIMSPVDSGAAVLIYGMVSNEQEISYPIRLTLGMDGRLFLQQGTLPLAEVGRIDEASSEVVLCSMEFSDRCELRYEKERNLLTVALSASQVKRLSSEGPYDWQQVALGDYLLELSVPAGLWTAVDVRISGTDPIKGEAFVTDPVRLEIDLAKGLLRFGDQIVGKAEGGTSFSLCGELEDASCYILVTANHLDFVFK